MLRIGVTGQNGFIGKHLFNTIGLFPTEFQRISFDRSFLDKPQELDKFVCQCDVVVHLAGVNRDKDPQVIFDANIKLASTLIDSFKRTKSKAHLIFSSSTQEEKDNAYGNSKQQARQMFLEYCQQNGNLFTGLIIPNVFGPFGRPFYNSVVATFCHQIATDLEPKIDVDSEISLIYVGELIKDIIKEIRTGTASTRREISHTKAIKVSAILELLRKYKKEYIDNGIIPQLNASFEVNLFNTLRCYMNIKEYFPVKFKQHIDPRGAFVEVIKLTTGGQVSFSTTVPGITRGNHFHTRKIERFAVIKGKALIQLRQIGTNNILDFNLSGDEPAYVDMPIWYTHNIKNVGEEDLYTIFWINEFFDPNDPDTFIETV